MPTSLGHGPKYKCRKINRNRHTLEIRANGTKHDIPNTNHLREKGRKGGGKKGLKRVHNQREKLNPKPIEHNRSIHVGKLASMPFLLAPRRSLPSSMCPRSMCTCKGKDKKPVNEQWKGRNA